MRPFVVAACAGFLARRGRGHVGHGQVQLPRAQRPAGLRRDLRCPPPPPPPPKPAVPSLPRSVTRPVPNPRIECVPYARQMRCWTRPRSACRRGRTTSTWTARTRRTAACTPSTHARCAPRRLTRPLPPAPALTQGCEERRAHLFSTCSTTPTPRAPHPPLATEQHHSPRPASSPPKRTPRRRSQTPAAGRAALSAGDALRVPRRLAPQLPRLWLPAAAAGRAALAVPARGGGAGVRPLRGVLLASVRPRARGGARAQHASCLRPLRPSRLCLRPPHPHHSFLLPLGGGHRSSSSSPSGTTPPASSSAASPSTTASTGRRRARA